MSIDCSLRRLPLIYVSDPIDSEVFDALNQKFNILKGYGSEAVPYLEVAEAVEAILLRAETFGREKIEASPKLRIIARHGVGTDNVDIEAATERGIWVTTTPGSNSRAVAEHVFALAFTLARRTAYGSLATQAGQWAEVKPHMQGFEFSAKTLGLVGFGSIARLVHNIGNGLGMKTVVSDPLLGVADIEKAGAKSAILDQVVATSDVLSIHVPLTKTTAKLVGAEQLRRMQPHAILINTSRGGVVDEAALANALEKKEIGGAALDVLEGESVDMRRPLAHSPIMSRGLSNLVVTPHVAGQTVEAFATAGRGAARCIAQALAGTIPDHAVNRTRIHGVR